MTFPPAHREAAKVSVGCIFQMGPPTLCSKINCQWKLCKILWEITRNISQINWHREH